MNKPPWKLKHRTILLAVAIQVLVGLFAFLLWPRKPTPYRLRFVRQAVEQGKPVAFFRIEGGGHRRGCINGFKMFTAEGKEISPHSPHIPDATPFFWGSPEGWPVGDENKFRKEFGVVVPTNAPQWRLQVEIVIHSPPGLRSHLKDVSDSVSTAFQQGRPMVKAGWDALNIFYARNPRGIQSDLFTNSVPRT